MLRLSTLGTPHQVDAPYNKKIIFVHYAQNITVWVFIMKEYMDLLIEEKWVKQDEFATFIADM